MFVFFDIDETLINQREAERAAAARFLEVYGHSLPAGDSLADFCALWRRLREKHAAAFFAGQVSCAEQRRRRIRELFAECDSHLPNAEADARFAIYHEAYRNSWSLFDDVAECLPLLAGHSLGIISNGSSAQQRQKLGRTGIDGWFRTIVISEEVGFAKPSREIFLAACRQTGCSARDCVYIGDRLDADVRGSLAAGMRGIWLNRGVNGNHHDVEMIRSLTELPRRLA